MDITTNFIKIRNSHLHYYRAIPLYYRDTYNGYSLYKAAGTTITDMRIDERLIPKNLFISKNDKIKGIREVQKIFNKMLKENINNNEPEKIKDTVVTIVEETFLEPRSGALEGLSETVNILVSEYTTEPEIIKNFWLLSQNDYTTALHCVNVMALALGYAASQKYTLTEKKILGLCALLHDVGKASIDTELLTAPRKLTDEEFRKIQCHTTIGHDLLKRCNFARPEIRLSALQHHEKLDGSGYPNKLVRIPKISQIIGLIDCYEALTNDDRPYRDAIDPYNALTIIKEDVINGKFSKNIFEQFVYSFL